MTVYIEDTLIENFLITFFIINIIFGFLREKKSNLRVCFASCFGAIISLIYPLISTSSFFVVLIKFGVAYVITLIAYNNNKLKKQIFFFLMFMAITAIYGGINLMIYYSIYGTFSSSHKLPTIVFILLLFIITFVLKQFEKVLYKKKTINNFMFDVVICKDKKIIKSKAYLDSGNILCDPISNKPIILVNFKIFEQIYDDYSMQDLLTKNVSKLKDGHYVKVKTATSVDTILAFSVDCLKIVQKNKTTTIQSPMFALSKVNISGFDCDVILNSKIVMGV